MALTQTDWAQKKCKACSGADVRVFSEEEAGEEVRQLEGWTVENGNITRTFKFENYYQTSSFVNSVVWIAHREDHHPDIRFGYKECKVNYTTHKKSAITENDFICAAKINTLLK